MKHGTGNKIFDVLSVLSLIVFIVLVIVLMVSSSEFAIAIGIAVAIIIFGLFFLNGIFIVIDWIIDNI